MMFKQNYTTASLKLKEPVAEKDKVVVSEEAYLIASMLDEVSFRLNKRL